MTGYEVKQTVIGVFIYSLLIQISSTGFYLCLAIDTSLAALGITEKLIYFE